MRQSHRRRLDLIVFVSILTAGIVLVLIGVPADSLATITVALSGLYGAWTSARTTAPRDSSQAPDEGAGL
ncbi:hypothetical protein [Streptomyces radiopugnans]|uniref:hypothetical protein n=1 Tax=Streptomyces radiopugnans TaxID=403935 RepID=UPI003F193C29